MTIVFTKDTIGIWFVSNDKQDVMAHLAQAEGEVPELTIRTRTYVDDKVWDSDDKKSWHTIRPSPGYKSENVLQEMLDKVEGVMKQLSKDFGRDYSCVLMGNGGIDEFFEEFTSMPGIHSKNLTKEEYEEKYGKDTEH